MLRRWSGDPLLVAGLVLLSLFGIAMIYSAGVLNVPSAVVEGAWKRQLVWFGLALTGFTVLQQLRPRWFEWFAVHGYVVSVALLVVTLIVGTGAGTAAGVKSFLRIGPIGFQPAEFAKIATILALARLLGGNQEAPRSLRDLVPAIALVGLPLGLVVLQPDLGTALAFIGILFAALFWAGVPLWMLGLLASPGVGLILTFDTRLWSVFMLLVVGALYMLRYRVYLAESVAVVIANLAAGTVALPLWNSLADYQKNRILVFLDPTVDPRGAGWQLIQSKVAIGSGGFFGKGFTQGTQKRLDFLPEQHTDFIFSVIGEELGFVGTALALTLFAFVLYRLVRMAESAPEPFAGLVIFGIFGAWLVHIVVNVGMTVGVLPITGIPLPFLSYGGSFLLMSWLAAATAVRVMEED